jgi:hypothetical protein
MGGTDEELREFGALSAKVASKQASDIELARWRELRAKLAPPPKAPMGGTQRKHVRKVGKLRVAYTPISEMTVTFTDEIGGGGIRFRAPRHFELGTELALNLELGGPTGPHVFAVGRVVWSRREGGHFAIGVALPSLKPEERERLEAFAHAPPAPAR